MTGRAAVVCVLGRVGYRATWTLQEKVKDRLIESRLNGELLPHVLLLLEHPAVYTLGRSGNAANLLVAEAALKTIGAAFCRTDRGGDITFHGPGQLVGYFLLDLDRLFRDLHRYMRALEEVVIRTLADYGLAGKRVEGRTGVWVGRAGSERKICALGIRSSRWVSMHGIALNVNTDLSFYHHIVPCGIIDRGVTSLAAELGHRCDEAEVRFRLAGYFGQVFGLSFTTLAADEAYQFLEGLTGQMHLKRRLCRGTSTGRRVLR